MKKIRVYYKKFYLFTTGKYKTIKELKNKMQERQGKEILIHTINEKGRGTRSHIIDDLKHYNFEIVKQ